MRDFFEHFQNLGHERLSDCAINFFSREGDRMNDQTGYRGTFTMPLLQDKLARNNGQNDKEKKIRTV
jgi:hypothetical protein